MREELELQKISLNKFCQNIELLINDLVQENSALNWDEDFLTRKLLAAIKEKLDGSIISELGNKVIFLTPFKLKKTLENKYGDIAIIVKINYDDGDSLNGVAFLEAKRKYKESGHYDAIHWGQLKRIYGYAPHSQLLLYDYRDITDFAPNALVSRKNPTDSNPMLQIPVTKFVVAPINKVLQLKHKSEKLYKLSLPFSYQLGYRYLNGFDLDYNSTVLDAVKGDFEFNYENLDIPIPEYLLSIEVISEKGLEESNQNFYNKKKLFIKPKSDINNDYLEIKKEK